MALASVLVTAVVAARSLAGPVALDTTVGTRPDALPVAAARACSPMDRVAGEHADGVAAVGATIALHGAVVRWQPETGAPLRLWVQPRPATLAGPAVLATEWRQAVLDAAGAWRDLVPGLALTPVADSAAAEVRVVWGSIPLGGAAREHGVAGGVGARRPGASTLPAGRTALVADAEGRARSALVVLALTGEAALETPEAVRTVARHEFGHALGLAHHARPDAVMAPVITATRLGAADRAALRLLYRLPPGARCAAR